MKQLYIIEPFGDCQIDRYQGSYNCLKNAQDSAIRKFSKLPNIHTVRVHAVGSNLCYLKNKGTTRWTKIEHEEIPSPNL